MRGGDAQHPPEAWAWLGVVWTELALLSFAGLAGLLLVSACMAIGLLPDPTQEPWSAVVAGPLLMAGALGAHRLIARRRGDDDAPLVPASERASWPTSLAVVALHIAAAVVGSSLISWVQEFVFDRPVSEQDTIMALIEARDPSMLVLLGIAAVVAAPLTEEALFRGAFFRRLRNGGTGVAAWILPALVFALAHWNPVGLLIYAWLGLVFAHAYAQTGRLAAAMLTHAGANAITFALLLAAPSETDAAEPALAEHADDGAAP